jgi:hypothetical protein
MTDALATRTRTYSVDPSIMGEILATYGARTLTLKVNDCFAFLDVLLVWCICKGKSGNAVASCGFCLP